MEVLPIISLALGTGNTLLVLFDKIEKHLEGRKNLPKLFRASWDCLERIYAALERYKPNVDDAGEPEKILKLANDQFEEIRDELNELPLVGTNKILRKEKYSKKFEAVYKKLETVEGRLIALGLNLHYCASVTKRLENLNIAVNESRSRIDNIFLTLCLNGHTARKPEECATDYVRSFLNHLARSGVHEEKKVDLAKKLRALWDGWKVNQQDIKFIKGKQGKLKIIARGGSSVVYKGFYRPFHNSDQELCIPVPVAIKQLHVQRSEAPKRFAEFMRELFLQMETMHPCVVRTFGGFWPEDDSEDAEDDDNEIEPYIVMEELLCSLRMATSKGHVTSLDTQRRVLGDVAEGLAHLHERKIVHRDLKPENVLLNIDSNGMWGRAKISDFGLSCVMRWSTMGTTTHRTGITGTVGYLPPECDGGDSATRSARDVWSYGVVVVEVMRPHCLNIMPLNDRVAFLRNEASQIEDQHLRRVALQCLSADPAERPLMQQVVCELRRKTPILVVSGDESAVWVLGEGEWIHDGITDCGTCQYKFEDMGPLYCVRLFSGARDTYIVFTYVDEDSITTAITRDDDGKLHISRRSVAKGQVLIRLITEGEQARSNRRQSLPYCCFCYTLFETETCRERFRSVAFSVEGKGYLYSVKDGNKLE